MKTHPKPIAPHRLTQLDKIVDGQQQLCFLRYGLHGGGTVLLIGPGKGLRVLVAGVQQGADDHIVQVPTEIWEIPVAYGRRKQPLSNWSCEQP